MSSQWCFPRSLLSVWLHLCSEWICSCGSLMSWTVWYKASTTSTDTTTSVSATTTRKLLIFQGNVAWNFRPPLPNVVCLVFLFWGNNCAFMIWAESWKFLCVALTYLQSFSNTILRRDSGTLCSIRGVAGSTRKYLRFPGHHSFKTWPVYKADNSFWLQVSQSAVWFPQPVPVPGGEYRLRRQHLGGRFASQLQKSQWHQVGFLALKSWNYAVSPRVLYWVLRLFKISKKALVSVCFVDAIVAQSVVRNLSLILVVSLS